MDPNIFLNVPRQPAVNVQECEGERSVTKDNDVLVKFDLVEFAEHREDSRGSNGNSELGGLTPCGRHVTWKLGRQRSS